VTQITELRDALVELRQYLSDRIPPLMAADSVEMLLEAPAEIMAHEMNFWAAQQQDTSPEVSIADFLYHAVKKVAILGELDLVRKEALTPALVGLSSAVLAYCPEQDRDFLQHNLERLTLGTTGPASADLAVDVLYRQSGMSAVKAPAAAPAVPAHSPGYRRLSLFLDRLQPQAQAQLSIDRRNELASHFVTTAAAQARNEQELEQHLAPLREYGIETAVDKLFRTLAYTLPGWGNLATVVPEGVPASLVGAQLNAMRQIVALAPDPAEGAKRFRDLIQAAIEQFNEGNLGRAVTMFTLAEDLVAQNKVQPSFVDALRQGHAPLYYERLRKYAERKDARPDLRRVMNFFYALRPEGLLAALNGEARRDRRHELLAMLEAHEDVARAHAYELLKTSIEKPESKLDPFFQMNLVYLLRVIPRPKDAPISEEEVSIVTRTPGRDSPPPLVKQVISYLAFTRHEKCERGLMTYLHVFENMLLQPDTAVYERGEVETLLDRTCAALARYGTPRAWRALVDHGLKTEVKLGSPTARLVEAGRQDLSSSPELVDRLITAVRAELMPKSFIGMFVKNDDRIIWLLQALSGTPTADVRSVLEDIIARYPGQRFTEAASHALATLGVASRPTAATAGLSGDLELFGLPGVLQTLSQSALTGVLTLMNTSGKMQAVILIDQGQFRGAQYLHLRGTHAVYQLLERPFPGTFAFVSRNDVASLPPAAPARDITGVILEGVRRHDEFKRAAAMVPDDAVLHATNAAATPPTDEEPQLVKVVWDKAVAHSTPQQTEALITRDSYHVRRVLAHWVEEGALKIAS
jgi:hypothetical protein